MAEQPEVIQQQMEETRSRLAENLDKLSKKTVDTVEEVASSVTETVEAVQGTVEAVTETVQDTKEFFDISGHVQRNPWLMVGGSVAVGFLAGYLLFPSGESEEPRREAGPAPEPKRQPESGEANRLHGYWPEERSRQDSGWFSESGWLSGLMRSFEPAIDKLKGLAIGATLGLARDAVTQSLSGEFAHQVGEVIDDVTKQLGGQPVAPAAHEQHPPAETETHSQPKGNDRERHHFDRTKMDRPVGAGSR
jgi:ElaB/YqjD/DUF883 family membrane-anchored ribosome-binding protein